MTQVKMGQLVDQSNKLDIRIVFAVDTNAINWLLLGISRTFYDVRSFFLNMAGVSIAIFDSPEFNTLS